MYSVRRQSEINYSTTQQIRHVKVTEHIFEVIFLTKRITLPKTYQGFYFVRHFLVPLCHTLNDWHFFKSFKNGYLREFEVSNRHLPYEVFAVAAECRLLEETWDEFMVLHVVHIFLFQGSLSASKSQTEDGIQISRAIVVHVQLLVRHDC